MKKKKILKKAFIVLLCLAVVGVATLFIINSCVKSAGKNRILTVEQAAELENVDCIIVLGCQVKDDGSLSHMLRDRLMRGLELYEAGAAPKLLMSGDHGREDYDEVGAMKDYAIENGVSSEDVFMDHAGFSTYETIYRAKEIFEADKVIIVTQEYHLYRALYIAQQFGVDAYGVSADLNTYAGQSMRDFREVLARCKDWAMCIFKPEPTYLGEAIPVSGNGDITND
uniref:SanA/YdcF family protein n=1 Tax=Agathobacter sp. TaxID=2021311 RepID=UPI0040571E8A